MERPCGIQDAASQGVAASRDLRFTIVEVDYRYTPIMTSILTGGAQIPMSSYALIKRY